MENPTREWFLSDLELTIAVSETALESMRRAAMVGLQKIPRRGLEIGGVLFGRRKGSRVEIVQWREIECEHARGPGFALSEKDEQGLAELLEAAKEDATLGQLEAVGLFRTRTKGELMISEEDAALLERYFPEPWQPLFVVRPYMYEAARAGFFLRNREGRLGPAPAMEFPMEVRRRRLPLDFDPGERPRRAAKEPAETRAVEPVPAAPPGPAAPPQPAPSPEKRAPAPPAPVPEPAPYPWAGRGRGRLPARRLAVIAAAGVLAALAGILLAPLFGDRTPAGVALGVRELGGQLIVEWNPQAPAVRTAAAGELEIFDGGDRRTVELSPAELRGGSLTYAGGGGKVKFLLRIRTAAGAAVTETVQWTGAAGQRPAASQPGRRPETADLELEIERLKSELEQQRRQAEELRRAIEAKRNQLAARGR